MNSDVTGKDAAPESGLSGLQFDRAELPPVVQPLGCALCGAALSDTYYALNGHPICSACGGSAEFTSQMEPTKADLIRAAVYGSGAALAGTVVYFAILALSGYEIGLIAVAVGWFVGKAVNKGGRGLGGRKLQIIAVLLTYLSIVGSYVPLVIKHAIDNPPGQQQSADKASKPAAPAVSEPPPSVSALLFGVAILFAYCMVMPFLQGFSSIIGLFIIFIGLFEAWKWNRRVPLTLEGPFPVTQAAGA